MADSAYQPVFVLPDHESNGNGTSLRVNGNNAKADPDPDNRSEDSSANNRGCAEMSAQRARNCCSKKNLYKRLPILEWLPKYDKVKAVSDLIAGVTVGLTVIPQGIAYATVAELPPQYGLYSAFMGCFAYCVFGTSKDITVGPTAIMAIISAEHANKGPELAVLLAFLAGLIIFALGVCQLGFVIDFISVPVTAGFTSAAAITIASTQIKALFGLDIPQEDKSHIHGIVGTYIDIFKHLDTIRWTDTVLGFDTSYIQWIRLKKTTDKETNQL